MDALWKAVSDYPFDERGLGPLVMISFVRDGGRTARMAYARRNAKGGVDWHGPEPLPSHCHPDIWLDGTPWSRAASPDVAAAIARKVEELTVAWPSRGRDTNRSDPSMLAAE